MLIFNLKKKKVEFGTFMCCTIIENVPDARVAKRG